MQGLQINSVHNVCESGHCRSNNEDSVHCGNKLWLVADGMGGHNAGEVASAMAVAEVASVASATVASASNLTNTIKTAHAAIVNCAENNPAYAGMGTTLAAVQQQRLGFIIAWVGDSRIYHWQPNDGLLRLSDDHSFVQDMIFKGVLNEDEARQHPKNGLINQALGMDMGVGRGLRPGLLTFKARPQGTLLLCSDGVSDMLTDAEITAVFGMSDKPEQRAENLKQAVLATEARDNFSFILIDYQLTGLGRVLNKIAFI